jgi:hypothetical protein
MKGKQKGREEEEDIISSWIALRKKRVLSIEKGSSRLHCVRNSLWKWLWACRLTDFVVM